MRNVVFVSLSIVSCLAIERPSVAPPFASVYIRSAPYSPVSCLSVPPGTSVPFVCHVPLPVDVRSGQLSAARRPEGLGPVRLRATDTSPGSGALPAGGDDARL